MIEEAQVDLIKHILSVDEGIKQFPYLDCCGKPWRQCQCPDDKKGNLTVGIGRNLDTVGISQKEAYLLAENDINDSIEDVERSFSTWFSKLSFPRKLVIICMRFNVGMKSFRTFEKMIKNLASGDYQSASKEMMNSKWAIQVGKRSKRLAETMKTGVLQG